MKTFDSELPDDGDEQRLDDGQSGPRALMARIYAELNGPLRFMILWGVTAALHQAGAIGLLMVLVLSLGLTAALVLGAAMNKEDLVAATRWLRRWRARVWRALPAALIVASAFVLGVAPGLVVLMLCAAIYRAGQNATSPLSG